MLTSKCASHHNSVTSQLPKAVPTWCAFHILTSKCASCHYGAHFLNITTSKSVLNLMWFWFPHVSRATAACTVSTSQLLWFFLAVWLPNALRATGACTFLASQLPKVVQTCGSFYMLTSKCTSRHNAMHFFDISTSKSAPTLKHHVCKCFNMFNHVYFDMCFGPQRRALLIISASKSAPRML